MGEAVAAKLLGQREQLPLPQPVEEALVVGIGPGVRTARDHDQRKRDSSYRVRPRAMGHLTARFAVFFRSLDH